MRPPSLLNPSGVGMRWGAAAQLLLALVVVCLHHTTGACSFGQRPRRLLQDTGKPCNAVDCKADNDAVHVVEVDLVDKECVVMQNAWFDGPLIPSPNGGALQVASPLECCKACFDQATCSVWTYCSREAGCFLPGGIEPRQLPHGGCHLVALPNFHPVVNSSTSFRIVGREVPFMSGAPITLTLPKVPNYQINPGVDLNSQFDYRCPMSLRSDVCEVVGSAQELANLCNADEKCKGFVYLPKGLDFKSAPIGILKGGDIDSIPLSALAVNPSTALFVKDSVVYGSHGSGSSHSGGGNSHTVLFVVVPVAVAVAVAMLCLLGLFTYRLRAQQRAAASEKAASEHGAQHVPSVGSPKHGAVLAHAVASWRSGGDPAAVELDRDHLAQEDPAAVLLSSPSGGAAAAGAAAAAAAGARQGPLVAPWQGPGSGLQGQARAAAAVALAVGPADSAGRHAWHQLAMAQRQQEMASGAHQHAWQQGRVVESPLIQELLRRFAEDGSSGCEGSDTASGSDAEPLQRQPSSEDLSSAGGKQKDVAPDAHPLGAAQLEAQAGAGAAVHHSSPSPWQGSQQQLPHHQQQQPAPPPCTPSLPPDKAQPLPALGSGLSVSTPSVQLPTLPWSDWVLAPEEVEVCRRPDGSWWLLGSGAFGTVYKGLYHGVQPVAVKVLHADTDPRVVEEFVKEIMLLKSFRDRNIVQFLGASLDGAAAMLVTEFMELGDLWRALPLRTSAGERIFSWGRRGRRVALDVAKGLHYLHHKRVVHLDLKSANILLSRHGTAKICDVGFSRVLTREYVSMFCGTTGTFAWSAPEVLAGKRCTVKVDIYSFGVVLWEIATGEMPVRGGMRLLSVPEDCPQEVADLQARCTLENPEERPSAAELVRILDSLQ